MHYHHRLPQTNPATTRTSRQSIMRIRYDKSKQTSRPVPLTKLPYESKRLHVLFPAPL